MKKQFDFKTVMIMIKKYWWLLLITLCVGAGLGYVRSTKTIHYRAKSCFYVSKKLTYDKQGNGVYTGDSERFWQSINHLSKTQKFKQKMKKQNKNFKSKSLMVDSNNGSNIVDIEYHGKSIKQSIAVAQNATETLKKMFLKYNGENIDINLIDQASKKTAKKTVTSNRKSQMLKGAIYGIFVGVLLAIAHFIFIGRKHYTVSRID